MGLAKNDKEVTCCLYTVPRPFLPHADFGAPDCGGCLNGVIRGEQANIVCNECGAVVRTLAAADLQRTLDEMELSLVM